MKKKYIAPETMEKFPRLHRLCPLLAGSGNAGGTTPATHLGSPASVSEKGDGTQYISMD